MFPKSENYESEFTELFVVCLIPRNSPFDFGNPIFSVCLDSDLLRIPIKAMPKLAINEDDEFVSIQNNIRFTGEFRRMQAISTLSKSPNPNAEART